MNKLDQRLMRTFLGELEERLQALNQDLLALEKALEGAQRSELLTSLLRTAHSLKGAAASVGASAIEAACHRLEETFGAARDSQFTLGPEVFGLLFASADAIGEAGAQLRVRQEPDEGRLASLPAALQAATDPAATPTILSAPASPSPASVQASRHAATEGFIRVAAEKLDALLAQGGELRVAQRRTQTRTSEAVRLHELLRQCRAEWRAIAKLFRAFGEESGGAQPVAAGQGAAQGGAGRALARLGERLRRIDGEFDRFGAALAADSALFERATSSVLAEVSRVRMLPFGEACAGLDRVVRDVGKTSGKLARLVVRGSDVEVDRAILEGLRDPLIHLVRNAVDHGIEAAEARGSAGKPIEGEVVVAAALRGSTVEVVVADDGRGLDLATIREQALRRNLPDGDDRELARHIFLPGFSTVAAATEVSGRGVGLDAVKTGIERMRGAIDVSFERGRGARFTLRLPLTLSTIGAVLVRAGGQLVAFDGASISRLVRAAPAELRSIEGRDVLLLGGHPVQLAWLSEILGLPAGDPPHPDAKLSIVLLASGERQIGFVVDEVIGEQEVMVRGLGRRLLRARNVAAATILPTGRIVLVLNSAELVEAAIGRAPTRLASAGPVGEASARRNRVLLADDSITTRTLEKSILEAAGYEVLAAADGLDAWTALQEQGADIVISDVEMPRMDGFALVETIRASPRFKGIPVVLVTARGSDADKARGLAVGADAYIVKSAFDQRKLLDTLAQLL